MFAPSTLLLATTLFAGDVGQEQAFKAWGDYLVGGVWTTKTPDNRTTELQIEWILNRKFIQIVANDSLAPWMEIHGIDPATGAHRYWGWAADGAMTMGEVTSAKQGEWHYRERNRAKNFQTATRYTVTKQSSDRLLAEATEYSVDGKAQPNWKFEFRRTDQPGPRITTSANGEALPAVATPAEKAFRDWANYFVGGRWSNAPTQGKKEEFVCTWIPGKYFTLGWTTGNEARLEINGMDPTTGEWTLWGFDEGGRVARGICQSPRPGEWAYEGKGQGNQGPLSYKNKDVRLGPDEDRFEIGEGILDGKPQPAVVQIWRRTRAADAETEAVIAEIDKLSTAYDAAIKAGDAKALDRLYADDGQFIDSDGTIFDKPGQIAHLTKLHYDSIKRVEHTIRVFGPVAVEVGTWTISFKDGEKAFHSTERNSTIWVKRGNTWVVILDHGTTVEPKK